MIKGAADHRGFFAFNSGDVARTRKIRNLSTPFIWKLLEISTQACLYDVLLIPFVSPMTQVSLWWSSDVRSGLLAVKLKEVRRPKLV